MKTALLCYSRLQKDGALNVVHFFWITQHLMKNIPMVVVIDLSLFITNTDQTGLMLTCLTAVCEIAGLKPTIDSLCVNCKTTATYGFGQWFCSVLLT